MKNLNRFLKAQELSYFGALNEIKEGHKKTHWMWYIFPQISGLGMSEISIFYSIEDLAEAEAYLEHEILGGRLRTIVEELLKLDENNPEKIFGYIDALKLKSSMTLFYYVSNEDIFKQVLDKFYDGDFDNKTIFLCEKNSKLVLKK